MVRRDHFIRLVDGFSEVVGDGADAVVEVFRVDVVRGHHQGAALSTGSLN
jgi:hypothetical protein